METILNRIQTGIYPANMPAASKCEHCKGAWYEGQEFVTVVDRRSQYSYTVHSRCERSLLAKTFMEVIKGLHLDMYEREEWFDSDDTGSWKTGRWQSLILAQGLMEPLRGEIIIAITNPVCVETERGWIEFSAEYGPFRVEGRFNELHWIEVLDTGVTISPENRTEEEQALWWSIPSGEGGRRHWRLCLELEGSNLPAGTARSCVLVPLRALTGGWNRLELGQTKGGNQ